MSDSIATLCADQRRRWLLGQRMLVETYLAQQPDLQQQPEAVLDLIYNEIVLRETDGSMPHCAEYVQRFPQFAHQLRLQFDVHRVIEEDQLGNTSLSPQGNGRPAPAVGTPQVAGYEILSEIGRGGMGVVYQARHLRLNRLVALKMIGSGCLAGQQEIDRFRSEAEAVARLQHPNIVQIYEIGENTGLPFLALELVGGPSLDRVIKDRRIPAGHAAQVVQTLALAVDHVHRQGIVHRDLKPANILLAPAPAAATGDLGGRRDSGSVAPDLAFCIPKLTDFGLARLLNDDAAPSVTKTLIGTPQYMAPEQTLGQKDQPAGPLADIHALGTIFYELLTGQPPFDGKTVLEVLERVRGEDPVPPAKLCPGIPRDLESICLKCLQKDPARRYGSALDLAEDLRRFLAHEPIRARPIGLGERAVKWVKRRPARAGLLAVMAVAAALLLMLEWQHRLAWQTKKDEERQARLDYQRFARHRGDALFHWSFGSIFPNDNAARHHQATEAAARQALAMVALDSGSESPPLLNPCWSDRERAEVAAGCYQLFLVLADVSAEAPSRSVAAQRQNGRQAIAILDRAARLFAPTRAYHLRRARYLQNIGDDAAAHQELQRAEMAAPASLVDYLLLGHESYQQGIIEAAAHYFHQALLLEAEDFWSQCFLAMCQMHMTRDRFTEAEAGLTRCLEQRPDFPWTMVLRGQTRLGLDNFDGAENDFRRALEFNPEADLRYVIAMSRGLGRYREKKFDQAIVQFEEAIALRPDEFHARINLAKLYQLQSQLSTSTGLYEQALAQHPPNAVAAACHAEISRNLQKAGQYQAAVLAADSALKILPDFADGYQQRAFAFQELRDFAAALRDIDQFLAKGGKADREFYTVRGQAKMQLGDFPGAKDDYTRAIWFGPEAGLLAHRGWAYGFADAWKLALNDFDEAIRMDLHQKDAHTGRGLARAMLGLVEGAVADAEEALSRKPETPEMMHNIACIFALAAARTGSDLADRSQQALAADYRDQALEAIRKTLAMLNPPQRQEFWLAKILPDTALASIRNCPGFKELAAKYSVNKS